jgi:ABC-type lipoprotein export system ATPase subunit
MKNVNMNIKDDVLTITVNLKERHGKSGSGKTTIVASTEGNIDVPGHEAIKMGINLYTKD